MAGGIQAADLGFVIEKPHQSRQDVGYQSAIIRATRNFEGTTWVAYDRQYCQEALARKNLNWLVVNSRLYSEAFTRRAKVIPRCHPWLSCSKNTRSRPLQAAMSLVYLCNQCMRGHHIYIYIVYAYILVPSIFALHPLGVNTCFVRSAMYVVAFNGR